MVALVHHPLELRERADGGQKDAERQAGAEKKTGGEGGGQGCDGRDCGE